MYKYKRREKMKEMSSQEKNRGKMEKMSTEEKIKEKYEKMSPQTKYREVTAGIRILSTRAIVEDNKEIYEKLKRLAQYLEEVRIQRHLCQPSEIDREEWVRYRELLEYINSQYDGTEETLKEICRELDKREDIDKVLKYYDKKNNESKEEER